VTTRLWVIGDSWADPRTYPWAPALGWPTLLAQRLDLGLVNSATAGAGYAAVRVAPPNFPAQAAQGTGAGAGVVITWGSLNDPSDGRSPEEVGDGAATTFALAGRLCPDATLVVCGPQWGALPIPPELLAARDAVAAAARDAGAVFLDVSRWLQGRPELVLPDGFHPNPGGHALIADRLLPDVLFALAVRIPPDAPAWDDSTGWIAPYTIGAATGDPLGADSSP
jgi:hypothetical protein